MNLVEKQTLAFSLFDQKQKIGRDISKESASFLWQQMLTYVLKQMPQDQQSKQEMLEMCRHYYRHNKHELKNIDEFQSTYKSDKAIQWYTDECFLYKLLNKALRTEDIELLYIFRFFIIDLCAALEKERLLPKGETILTLYRGTQISNEELEKLKQNEGKIISTNGFLSTSRNIHVSLGFARQSLPAVDFQAVLFEIEADPSLNTVVFADIENKTRLKGEEEVLFSLNALFKIRSVDFDLTLDIWKVELTVTDEGSHKIQEYLTLAKHELDDYAPIIYFGRLLLYSSGYVDRADKYFQMLLKSLPFDHEDTAAVYNQIGAVQDLKDELDLALENYELAYEIRQIRLPPDHPHIAASLNNIGGIYKAKGDPGRAIDYYNKALNIQKKNYPGDHVHKAMTMENIGRVYTDKNDFDTALLHLFRALDMYKRVLPAQHPDIARCLGNIGVVHEKKGNFDNALDYYHQQLEMDEQCLPIDHPDRSKHLDWIVDTYKKVGEIEKALNLCRKQLNIQKSSLHETHPCIARTLINMADVLEDKDPNQALDHYASALCILEQSTPPDHRAISQCLTSMACLYSNFDMLDNALQCQLKALDLNRQILPSNHASIANNLRNIGLFYQAMNKSSEALRYLDESLSIYRANYGQDHEYVKRGETDIVNINIKIKINSISTSIARTSSTSDEDIEEYVHHGLKSTSPSMQLNSTPQLDRMKTIKKRERTHRDSICVIQ
ncbi:unnamed protein product [Rotaria sordida]|uniref:ADP ribosyltransferase domain-containing protein n=1 Tax=Rotaria sordida TaxID=392033 RepID=A0A814UW39_9BILA|nr:unnamed protein product [Rotaria sordida]CAF1436126.1 unnamed protein product [Rotaria sordida]